MRAFISYSHDSPEHLNRVWDLSERLRNDGIDCRIDQHEFSPPEGWPRWCRNQVQESQFVLVVSTETYKQRYEGKALAGEGKGAKWEGFIITSELYEAEGKNTKFIPVVFSPQDAKHIPAELRAATHYDLSTVDAYEDLLRHLTNQPRRKKSPVASRVKAMPPPQTTAMPPLPRRQQFSGPIWNVPIGRNRFFTGREWVLADLEKGLRASGLVALTGMGGVGKTQIAAHFAHQHRDEYSAVLWASAMSEATLVSDFAAIAVLLGLSEKDAKDQTVAAAAVKRWFEANGGWLLILDNVNDLAVLDGLIPGTARGHAVLTTQAQATGEFQAIEVREMLLEDGALLLLRRAKVIKAGDPLSVAAELVRDTAMRVCAEVDSLPLALDQAGGYIDETRCGLAGYLDRYRQRRSELLKLRGRFDADHPESVATTFALSFEKMASANSAAGDLLRLCAFLRPDAIPEEIFTEGASELGPILSTVAADPLKLDAAFAEILKYSLLRRDGEAKTLVIHRLVQAVIQDGLTEDEKRQWAERAVRAVNQTFPRVEFANWAQCERLVPQALASAALVETYSFEFTEAARLLNRVGYYLDDRARYSDAEPRYQRALAIWEKALGPDHPDVASGLNNLGLLYFNQGKYAQAEPLYQRALAIREKTLGPDHSDVAGSLNNLAVLYDDEGKYLQAEPLYQRALAIRKKTLGVDHPDVAASLNNLGELYRAQGRYAEAEPFYQRALATQEKSLGPDHPDVAGSLNNLAELDRAQGRYAEAEPLYQRALAIREKAMGPDHPDVAQGLNNLALLYHNQEKDGRAEPLFQRALGIWEKALGAEHPHVATCLNNLAALYRAQGRYAEAEPLLQQALATREKALGFVHPDVATSLNNLALLYQDQGKYAQAEPIYQRALAIWEKALVPDHPNVATVLENYARLLREMKRDAEAEEMKVRAKAIRAAHAKNNPEK